MIKDYVGRRPNGTSNFTKQRAIDYLAAKSRIFMCGGDFGDAKLMDDILGRVMQMDNSDDFDFVKTCGIRVNLRLSEPIIEYRL